MNIRPQYLHVTCSTDDNYVQHCMAMICSLFENNKAHEVIVHIFHHGLSIASQKLFEKLSSRYNNKVVFYDINPSTFEGVALNPNHTWLSMAAYYRFLISSLIPCEIDKILYLDCDIIVLQDISQLFKLQMQNYGVAAVKDCTPYTLKHRDVMGLALNDHAFCSGVMLINLKYWREHNCEEQLFNYAREQKDNLLMEDQDVLNYVFRRKWFQLPYKYGRTPLAVVPVDNTQKWFDIYEYVNEPCIFHYAAHVKPWLDVWFPDQHYYWHYVQISGFPNPQKTHANRQLQFKIYKTVTRYLINKYIRPFVPDFIDLIIRDIYFTLMFIANIFRPARFKNMMLKRWCQKYGM